MATIQILVQGEYIVIEGGIIHYSLFLLCNLFHELKHNGYSNFFQYLPCHRISRLYMESFIHLVVLCCRGARNKELPLLERS